MHRVGGEERKVCVGKPGRDTLKEGVGATRSVVTEGGDGEEEEKELKGKWKGKRTIIGSVRECRREIDRVGDILVVVVLGDGKKDSKQ